MKLQKVMQLIGVVIIVYLSLQVVTIQIVILLATPSSSLKMQEDNISRYDARFSQVKDDLSSTKNALGYLGCQNQDIDTMTYHYFLTQYALTPVIIQDSTDKALILGNFPSELCSMSSINLAQNNLTIVKEYDDGIFLLGPIK
jgi:hypothetical protein